MLENKIIPWYEENKRDFPWRHTTNPYYIWVCEVMSQQTQMSRVIDYYYRFLQIFPTVADLANAAADDLLKAWEGLGYYSRVRNMQAAAQQVIAEYAGEFPRTYDALLSLKGVGTYTAAAVASISFGEPVAAVDGNVLRVVARLYELPDDILAQKTKNKVKQLLEAEMTTQNPSSFNQGFIELGATVCLPQNPKCQHCPLQADCHALKHGTISLFPVKKKKAKQKEIDYYTFILVNDRDEIYFTKQDQQALLHGLYALPQYEAEDNFAETLQLLEKDTGITIDATKVSYKNKYRHVFSHIIWNMETYVVYVGNTEESFYNPDVVALANAHRKVIEQDLQ